ncbi:YeeE/YedE thiosulfate transporter family protein [Lysobacter sp. D1-1-M9]|uniref:YeeE/YedE thiosulfate transporter family protein n=1 Tax=Novilysobacter longmucuonensis TaxID=3098603 RepID=UPI002FCC0703
MSTRASAGYADPYLAGAGLGLVLLAAFVLVGRGLGASGAFASTAAGTVAVVAPDQAAASPLFAHYLAAPGPWLEWLSFELLGVLIGGCLSAALAGRLRLTVERPADVSNLQRLALAFGGGLLMAAGAVLARGCTSGQALTGGALLSVGSWLFLLVAFAAAYALAPLLRRFWT